MDPTAAAFAKASNGSPLTADDIEVLLAKTVDEWLHLDYTSGKAIISSDGPWGLRKTVASFANSEGGIVLVGINGPDAGTGEEPWAVTGTPSTVGKRPWRAWIADCLAPLAPLLYPQPSIDRVRVRGKWVIVVSVHRADSLVPVFESGHRGPRYYLRFGDGSRLVPEYLLADLVAGRRARPRLTVRPIGEARVGPSLRALGDAPFHQVESYNHSALQAPWPISVPLTVVNDSLTWATIGHLISVSLQSEEREQPEAPPPEVLQYIEPFGVPEGFRIVSRSLPLKAHEHIAPLSSGFKLSFDATIPSLFLQRQEHLAWLQGQFAGGRMPSRVAGPDVIAEVFGALCLLAPEHPPMWLQLEAEARADRKLGELRAYASRTAIRVGLGLRWSDAHGSGWIRHWPRPRE